MAQKFALIAGIILLCVVFIAPDLSSDVATPATTTVSPGQERFIGTVVAPEAAGIEEQERYWQSTDQSALRADDDPIANNSRTRSVRPERFVAPRGGLVVLPQPGSPSDRPRAEER